ncbi:MAG: flgF [Nevskia sp.]|nr:flgF [Nevskia sp.]
MTSFSGIYSSLTGLFSFSSALNTISNDVANLNTPGFKASDAYFRDLGPQEPNFGDLEPRDGEGSLGQGVEVAKVVRQFTQGDIQSTGNATDLAINGTGFFVLHRNGQYVYTRAGQFTFDDQGHLLDSVTGAFVQAIGADGKLSDLVVNRLQINPPVPTTAATFTGNLSTGSTTASVSSINVVDASGASQTLSLAFTNNAITSSNGTTTTTGVPGSWKVVVTDANGAQIASGEIRFNGDGTPETGFNTLSFTLASKSGQTSTIDLNFGDPNTQTGTTSFSGGTSSTIALGTVDGTPLGKLTGITIDSAGLIQLTFSNGKTGTGQQLAIAGFANPDELDEIGKALFAIPKDSSLQATYGKASDSGNGTIQAQSLELANVDLSAEFSKIIILQRGYQGASQILNVSSKLLEDLYNSVNGK